MPCDGYALQKAAEEKRARELAELAELIANGAVKVQEDAMGNVEFVGWEHDLTGPGHWHDDCAYRTLVQQGVITPGQTQEGWLTN